MFYSHQLLARKASLGQIWMAATMHAKIDRKKLNKLNIIKICEEILNPKVPMALRLSGILMGGVAIVYERKVKLLYDDVTRLMVEINEAWKVKNVPDPNVLSKGKSKAKKEAITLPENQEINMGDIEESLQFSNTAPTMGFQHDAYFTMRLDNVNEDLDFNNGAREEEDPSKRLHQVDVENITLFERFESFQANENLYNRFERFDIEGDDETFLNVTSTTFTQIPTTLVPSPPRQDEPSRADISQDHHPEHPVIQHSDEGVKEGQEHRRRGPTKRKRRQPVATVMDYEQTIIPVHIYQHWLQNTSDIVSRRGRKKEPTNIMSSTKIAKLMKIPPVALISDLYNNETGDIYYPAPLLDLWNKSTQPPHDSPSARASGHHPPEPSFSSPPVPSQDFDGGLDNQFLAPPTEKPRDKVEHAEIFMDELRANLDFGLRAPLISSWKSGDSIHSFGSGSEHGSASHSDIGKGRFTKKRHSLSGNISGGLEPVAENAHVKLPRVSEMDPTPDQELIVETGPTQIQPIINQPRDVIADTIQAQMKAHFETPGVPPVESLDILAAGMTRKSAAALFYQTCVLASRDALKVEQKEPYGEILISRGSKM
ncbi:PREDICTED: sister chromatid cohesion 1 protein 1 isoform X2 [Lupinus angustifolius]|uniref:sister chromatid cohesion 1 protein 1 isoform X2 n=1 Tax=Lupinus angustifolius TaxID=3871 RepID=UPI00092FA4B2|nr:PREDICTED: sister chromatid cohesion 1 protein 1 isoform X2 [Lupinus angustifolius]